MKQELKEQHEIDAVGNLGGGTSLGTGIMIKWQTGPLGRDGGSFTPNGAFVEGVIQAAIGRLQFYQTAPGGTTNVLRTSTTPQQERYEQCNFTSRTSAPKAHQYRRRRPTLEANEKVGEP